MHPIVKHRKHISRALVAVVIAVTLFIIASLILSYRFREIASQLVSSQTNGQYTLTLNTLHLSIWQGKVHLENAEINYIDTSINHTITARFPAIYFKLNSWKDLLFKKKLSIDSVSLTHPVFEVFEKSGSNPQNKIVFQSVGIFKAINEAVNLFNVRAFQLAGGTFIYHSDQGGRPFESRHINISIRNFIRDENHSHRFLSTDDFEISISDQDWNFTDQNREIKFKKLSLSGRNQSFRLDSVQFSSSAVNHHSAIRLDIESLTFNSRQLSSFYEKNELLIDTLRCTRPVLQLQLEKDTATFDTSSVISESVKSFFTNIHVSFLDIHKGQFSVDQMAHGQLSHYATEKTNLKINDLVIRPDESPFLTTGNIDLKLKKMHFYTPDSLYELTMDEFDLYNNDLRFKNAFFSPSSGNHHDPSIFITIPVLKLQSADLKKLLEKQIKAEIAELDNPVVTIQKSGNGKNNHSPASWPAFHEGLRSLSELIQVNTLNIKGGNINYLSVHDSVSATMNDFNASIHLHDFLNSNSLTSLTRSIQVFEANKIIFHARYMNATINQLKFLNSMERSLINKLELTLINGITLQAEDLLLKKLNWDLFTKKNAIAADSLYIGEVEIKNQVTKKDGMQSSASLTPVSIGIVGIHKWKINYLISSQTNLKANGENTLFTNIKTANDHLLWADASGTIFHFEFHSPTFNANSEKIKFLTPGQILLSGIHADIMSSTQIFHAQLPELIVQSEISSTVFSKMNFPEISINQPVLEISGVQIDQHPSNHLLSAPEFMVGRLKISRGQFIYSGKDSLKIFSVVDLTADSFSASKENETFMHFAKMNLSLSDLILQYKKLNADLPSMQLTLTGALFSIENNQLALESFVTGNWKNFSMDLPLKKIDTIKVNNLTGKISRTRLDFNASDKFQWRDWISRISIAKGRMHYSDSIKEIGFNKLMWSPLQQELRIDSFFLQPRLTAEEYFSKTDYQSDYIQLNGKSITISGIDVERFRRDSLFMATRVNMNDANVDVWRDKRFPFLHGNEKIMPARLLNSIRYPFIIDSVTVKDGDIIYHEFSSITNREGIVPLDNVNATIFNLRNVHAAQPDTLSIRAKAKFLNSAIKKFRYEEAYGDSLGSFRLSVKATPAELNEFSRITNPLASVNIEAGSLDTMVARISGNKYAAIGEMIFYYHDLKFTLLDHEDETRKRISLSFVNFVANRFVIKTNNRKVSKIFYIRDREKFVFNYWIKAMMSGMLTSAGVKSNKAYQKQYQKLRMQYALPSLTF